MGSNTLFFMRHAETEKDPTIPVIDWTLSKIGKDHAEMVAENKEFKDVDVVVSSQEEKAYLTAKPLADKLGKKIVRMAEFNELKRGGKFLARDEFEKFKREKLEDWDCKKDGGESAREALARFESGIDEINDQYDGKSILVVSHGTILSIYFAKLANRTDSIYARWQKTEFCAWGKVNNGVVEKDIVENQL